MLTAAVYGCAIVPDVTLTYYRTKWNAQVTVTQTVGCKTETGQLYIANALTVTPSYASDTQNPFRLKIKDLQGWYADSEMRMDFTDDGRLKSINQSTTGQGESIVKSAVGLVTALAAGKGIGPFARVDPCQFLSQVSKDKSLVTLTYRATIDKNSLAMPPELTPAQDSMFYYQNLRASLPKLQLKVEKVADNGSGPSYAAPAEEAHKMILLELQKTGFVEVSVSGAAEALGPARITVPEDATYQLPIPKGELFGKQAFSLTMSDAGAVGTVGYNRNIGAVGALNALGAVANAETPAAKAADLKAQADLIAQQQRLVLCQTQPTQCK